MFLQSKNSKADLKRGEKESSTQSVSQQASEPAVSIERSFLLATSEVYFVVDSTSNEINEEE